jgi:Trypsin-like peptidase domain
MHLALALAALVFALPQTPPVQAIATLHLRVSLVDAEGKVTPVPRHKLLLSENPASAAPRLIVTTLDGTADVRLRPGSYTVESEQPVAFLGKSYEWRQLIEIAPGRGAALELSADNAEVVASPPASTKGAPALESDPSLILLKWKDSVVGLWTEKAHASGFVIDAKGLIATNQRVVGTANSVEAQISPDVKVAARVLVSDAARDVAILWINPSVVASIRPLPLGCAQTTQPVAAGDDIFTLGVPLRQSKDLTSGQALRVEPTAIASDLTLPSGATGGPVFLAGGALIGLTSMLDDQERARPAVPVVRIGNVCETLAAAEKKMEGPAPDAARLPMEPSRAFPVDALRNAARQAGALKPYELSSSNFDLAFITPVLTYGAQYQIDHGARRTTSKDTRKPDFDPSPPRTLLDFANWSEYVSQFPPVLIVRVTPRLVEGFWTKVGRVAAEVNGVSLPPMKRFKSGFASMRAYCGDTQVTPIHPFRLEHRISDDDVIHEGLCVFDPDALGPNCGTVKLVMYSENEPTKGDTRVIDPGIVERVWKDFGAYRGQ